MSDQLIIPPGKKTGCLQRKSRVGQWCPMASERIETIPQGEWAELLKGITLSQHVKQVLDQDGVGSCATESTTQSIMMTREMEGQPFELLNPWFIYHTSSGGRDSGSSVDENLVFAREKGVAPESVWPRSKGWRATPTAEAYEAALDYRIEEFYDVQSVLEIGSCLLKGFVVVFGWKGHSVAFTDMLSPTKGRYINSWSASWSGDGFGELNFSSVNFGYGCWCIRTAKLTG